MSAPLVNARILEPLPGTGELAAIDEINPNITNVEITTEAPGGFGTARVGLVPPEVEIEGRYPSLTQSYRMRDKVHVEIEVGAFRAHEGMIQRWSADFDGFESAGYGLIAGEWASLETGGVHLGKTHPILVQAINIVDWWNLGKVDDPRTYRVWDDVRWLPVSGVIDSIVSEGNSTSPYTFLVYRNRRASVLAQIAPSKPNYTIAYDRSHMRLEYDSSSCIDGARMAYTKPDGTPGVTDAVYAQGVNRNASHLRIPILSGSTEASALAMQYLEAYVAYYSQPILTGTITYTDWDGPMGVAGYRVQAGEWIDLGGRGTVMIVSTSSNLSTGATTINVGPPPPTTLAGIIQSTRKVARRVARGQDPVTAQKDQGKMPYDLMGLINQIAEAYFQSEYLNNRPKWRHYT